jgi:CheY-like chemotaxis protein
MRRWRHHRLVFWWHGVMEIMGNVNSKGPQRSETSDAPHITVVNDDTIFLSLMYELLRDEGYDTTIIKASDEAYELIRANPPDLVVLDIRVGGEENGWLVLDLIRLDPTTAHIPVIVCSTDARLLAAKAEWLFEKRCDILEKPFDLSDLLRKIAALAGEPPATPAS